MDAWEMFKKMFDDDDGDFLQVSEAHNAEPRFSHKEIVDGLIKAGHATKVGDRVMALRRLFKPKRS